MFVWVSPQRCWCFIQYTGPATVCKPMGETSRLSRRASAAPPAANGSTSTWQFIDSVLAWVRNLAGPGAASAECEPHDRRASAVS